ncbi:MAG: hypothetical protein FWC62_05550 [Firmicutes bacterium]|nr:hypothetical protein [Bacillota bacterium]
MLNNTLINQLKQTNISADSEKTAQRVEAVWKSAKNAQKREVTELTGSAVSTVYRVYNTGHISAKLALALAQVLDVSPFYLSAESDEPGAFSEDALNSFLTAHGYGALVQEPEPKRRRAPRARRVKEAETEEAKPAEEPAPEDACIPEIEIEVFAFEDENEEGDDAPELSVELCDEDILILIHALRLKAACGAEGAIADLQKLYTILLG